MNSAEKIVFQWGRIQENSDWVLPCVLFAVCIWAVWRIYRKDSRELKRPWRILLPTLRTLALAVLFVLFLQPQWRSVHEETQNSCVAVLLDSSQSMSLPDSEDAGASSRAAVLMQLWNDVSTLRNLNQNHDLQFCAMDTDLREVARLKKNASAEEIQKVIGAPEWAALGTPRGAESRISDAIRDWIRANAEAAPVAGLVVCTDGAQNAGADLETAVKAARDAEIPVHTIGFGSPIPLVNWRIYGLEAPQRVQPHDPFRLVALVQGTGFQLEPGKTQSVEVSLFSQPVQDENSEKAEKTFISTQTAVLGEDGKVATVEFQVEPAAEGRFLYTVEAAADPREQIRTDNTRSAEVEVADRKLRVLVVAGGPTREYQFLLTTLYRDKTLESDIWLQSARPGIAQEATRILTEFPKTREELFSYDCIVAIDPNWKILDGNQIALLEEWVARMGGGLVLVAGPVYMGETVGGWLNDPNLSTVRAFYPVEFHTRQTSARQNTFAADQAWEVSLTREGLEAEFLRLADTSAESARLWAEFPGVYGYFPMKKLKSGAAALAHFSDPATRSGDALPVLLAQQFYGSGNVLYFGTGEFWRLRSLDPNLFVRLYTQTVRYAARGRMTRQSARGRLLLPRDQYAPGDSIEIRAQLFDPQLLPLKASEVELEAHLPSGSVQGITLRADGAQPGMFAGNFSVMTEGTVRLELPIPDGDERLERRIECVVGDLERENPQKNVLILETLARDTGGRAFADARDPEIRPFFASLHDRSRTQTVISFADPSIQRAFLWKMICAFIACVGLEWLLRRVLKLA